MAMQSWIVKKNFCPLFARCLGKVSFVPGNPFDKLSLLRSNSNYMSSTSHITHTASFSNSFFLKEGKTSEDYQTSYSASRLIASAAAAVMILGMGDNTSDRQTSCCGIVGVVGTGNYDAR
jgi:hypothetical protein